MYPIPVGTFEPAATNRKKPTHTHTTVLPIWRVGQRRAYIYKSFLYYFRYIIIVINLWIKSIHVFYLQEGGGVSTHFYICTLYYIMLYTHNADLIRSFNAIYFYGVSYTADLYDMYTHTHTHIGV